MVRNLFSSYTLFLNLNWASNVHKRRPDSFKRNEWANFLGKNLVESSSWILLVIRSTRSTVDTLESLEAPLLPVHEVCRPKDVRSSWRVHCLREKKHSTKNIENSSTDIPFWRTRCKVKSGTFFLKNSFVGTSWPFPFQYIWTPTKGEKFAFRAAPTQDFASEPLSLTFLDYASLDGLRIHKRSIFSDSLWFSELFWKSSYFWKNPIFDSQ